MPFCICDTKEARNLKGVYNSGTVSSPCHLCTTPFSMVSTPQVPSVDLYRLEEPSVAAMNDLWKIKKKLQNPWENIPKGLAASTGARAKESILANLSLHPYPNPWSTNYFGHTSGRGYFSMAWPEVMHCLESGLIKWGAEFVVAHVRVTGAKVKQADARVSLLDSRVRSLQLSRQSDRVSKIPCKNFPRGLTNLTKIKSQEYGSVLLVMMVSLGVGVETLLPLPLLHKVQDALSALYVSWYVLKRDTYPREESTGPLIQKLLERYGPRLNPPTAGGSGVLFLTIFI